jgi:hypothetical protein
LFRSSEEIQRAGQKDGKGCTENANRRTKKGEKMKGEEAMEIFKIVRAKGMLPKKIDDLVPLSFIGQTAVTFYRQMIKGFDQLKMTEAQRKRTLRDGQEAGEMLLDIEARIGELLPSEEEMQKVRSDQYKGRPLSQQKGLRQRPEGMSIMRAHTARTISKHPEIVEKVKAQARENEDIPTRTAVISEIRYQKEKDRRENAPPKSKTELAGEEFIYQQKLLEIISILPAEPPKQLTDRGFQILNALAKTIIKRLRRFENGTA